uniref:(northern house mosquito) hypothetical protein n=1 Tax=Culex pipiens TaxID=7175 RepID=A0A8D8G721_CULPI
MSHGRLPVDVDVLDRLKPVSRVRIEKEGLLLVVLLGEGSVERGGRRLELLVGLSALLDHREHAEDQASGQGGRQAAKRDEDPAGKLHQPAAALLFTLVVPGRAVGTTVTPQHLPDAGVQLRAAVLALGFPRVQPELDERVVGSEVGLQVQLLDQRRLGALDLQPRERDAARLLVDRLQHHADRSVHAQERLRAQPVLGEDVQRRRPAGRRRRTDHPNHLQRLAAVN